MLSYSIIIIFFLALKSSSSEPNPESIFHQFYSCYYAQYFSLDPGQEHTYMVTLVEDTVRESMEQDRKIPTSSCLEWICDEDLQWRRTKNDTLEIWVYWVEEGKVVDSWDRCYQDELEEFRRNNYSIHSAG